ncbi:MAG: hypothetical protein ACE5JB_14880 [bacterium]
MKWINILLIILVITGVNAYGENDAYIIRQRGFIKLMPLYQSWSIEGYNDFSEFSVLEFAYFPLGRNLSMALRGGQATANGDNLQSLSGVIDTQLSFSYHLESAHLVLNLGLNLPSGKKELNLEEFVTSSLISNNILNFQVPNFGQGLNVSPGFTWAVPVSENFVLGLGASYQLKDKFKPIKDFSDDYNPGDELLLTGGLDVRLSKTATFSTDIIFTTFGTDKIGNQEVFASGNRVVVNGQFRKYFNFNELWLFARYRSRAKSELAVAGQLVPEEKKTNPNQLEFMGHYRIRLSRRFYASILVEGRFYQETPAAFSGINLLGGGIAPEIYLSSNFKLPLIFKYLTGSFKNGPNISGFEIGIGFSIRY